MRVDSAVFYTNWLETIEEMDDDLQQLEAYRAIHRYQAYHEEPDVQGAPKLIFMMAKPIIDDLYSRRVSSIEKGKKGGRPRIDKSGEEPEDKSKNRGLFQKKPTLLKEKTYPFSEKNLYENDNDNENDNENVNENDNNIRFAKPSLEQVRSYCRERNNGVDPEQWYDYYSSNGWKVGKNSMKDWKAAVRTWERNSFSQKTVSDDLPTYDASKNVPMSKEEKEELLKLMGKGEDE